MEDVLVLAYWIPVLLSVYVFVMSILLVVFSAGGTSTSSKLPSVPALPPVTQSSAPSMRSFFLFSPETHIWFYISLVFHILFVYVFSVSQRDWNMLWRRQLLYSERFLWISHRSSLAHCWAVTDRSYSSRAPVSYSSALITDICWIFHTNAFQSCINSFSTIQHSCYSWSEVHNTTYKHREISSFPIYYKSTHTPSLTSNQI